MMELTSSSSSSHAVPRTPLLRVKESTAKSFWQFVGAFSIISVRVPARFMEAARFTQVFDYLVHNPFCGTMFQCGCVFAFDWNRGWRDCNIHDPAAPHCPWCDCASFLDGGACYVCDRKTFIAVALLVYALSRGHRFDVRVRRALAAWLAYGVAAGLFFFVVLAPTYPWFFGCARGAARPRASLRWGHD